MANYPVSLDSPTTTHADGIGEVIHASDINLVADAVAKIEAFVGIRGARNVIYLHDPKYSTPTNGTSDSLAAINAAIADVPIGGTLIFGPYTYTISAAINLSSRLDLKLIGSGGGVVGNYSAPYPGTVLQTTGTMNAFTISPASLTQYGPQFTDIHVIDGSSAATGWMVSNVNQMVWNRCSVKYAAKGWYFNAGSDNAWHDVYSPTAYQCTTGFHFDNNFGVRVHGGQIFSATNSTQGVLGSNQAQSNKFFGTFFDGSTTGSVGNGIGVSVDTTGAHDWDFYGCKMEALSNSVKLLNTVSGSPTRAIKFWGGSMAAYAGTETMISIASGVDQTVIDKVTFPNNNTYASMVSDSGTNTDWRFIGDDSSFNDTFAASYTPSSRHLGATKYVTMTANITAVGSIPDGREGDLITLEFIQDGTGGRTLPAAASWTGYALNAVSNTGNTASKRSVFVFKRINGTWVQVSGANTWF